MGYEDDEARDGAIPAGADPAAIAMALQGSRTLDPRAAAFLEKQSAFIDLQADLLRQQDVFETSHLRWRRFNDQMRGAMQIMVVIAGALLVILLGTALWNACQADGLVVDAFTVPADMAAKGLGGDVIATDLTNKIGAIRETAVENSFSSSSGVSKDGGDDIKVEIPETGVSISEAWRYLRHWLGHERHLGGSVRETADGKIVLAVSLDGASTSSMSGAPSELDALEQKAAIAAFAAFDPVNHINYLTALGRFRDSYDAATRYVPVAQGRLQRADSYGLWSYTTAFATGDLRLALARAQAGIAIDPDLAALHVEAQRHYSGLGRDEDALREARAILPLRNEDQPLAHQHGSFSDMQAFAKGVVAYLTGDIAGSAGRFCYRGCPPWDVLLTQAIVAAELHDPARSDRLRDQAEAMGPVEPLVDARAWRYRDRAVGDWNGVLAQAGRERRIWMTPDGNMSQRFLVDAATVQITPVEAEAEAHLGKFALAHAAIDTTPADCVDCNRVRGVIDALQKNWGGATYWFARAAHDAPSIPYADTDWGWMLMAKGDNAGAIAKFADANARGPHFADPLEMWGEALMRENRSDLALAKFEAAAQSAPNWGRLHLKWGEALVYAGKPDEAKAQFAAAGALYLTPSEKTELARVGR
jgi:tetratricopeptide (TPR) repeat protein